MTAEQLNIGRRLFRDDNGLEYPVVAWFNGDAQDCDPEDAVACTAGHEGRWFALRIADFKHGGDK